MRTTARLAAAAAVVVATGTWLAPAAAAAPASSRHATNRPVADESYEYAQLDFMANHYLMRYSGQDGPPGDPKASDGNLPPNVNGWQEFYLHWKQQVTSRAVMGRFAKDLHVDDHDFRQATASFVGPPPPYDSDVRTVTIPGARCPGQSVLIAGHPDSTTGLNSGNGSAYDDTSGITMGMTELKAMTAWWSKNHTWPDRTFRVAMFDGEEEGLYGSQYYASHLIPPGPQGKLVLVANMDQNGMEYPAHPAGTTKTNFGPGFWYTNINASPLKNFSIYTPNGKPGPMPAQFRSNLPAIKHFRAALAASVRRAFRVLGRKYHYSVPLENPLEHGRVISAYRQRDIAKYTPVQDDTLGRTDQVPFVAQGIPGYGIVGAYDSTPQDNPGAFPVTPLTPLGADGIPEIAGYDTPRDNMTHLNLMTSGTTGGKLGATGSVELKRALELPMTWTLYLISRPEYVGDVTAPRRPVAYFEALPTAAKPGTPIRFNGADTAANGNPGLTYHWAFGDGSRATGAVVHHAYTHAGWYLARLAVRSTDGKVSGYEQMVKVGSPTGHEPKSNKCGLMPRHAVARLAGSRPMRDRDGDIDVSGTIPVADSTGLPATGLNPLLPIFATGIIGCIGAVARRRIRRR